jgi:hypothetical protein
MKKLNFKVEQPTLLAASFSVMTSADDRADYLQFR